MNYEKLLLPLLEQEQTDTFWSGESINAPEIWRLEKSNFRWYYRTEPIRFYTSITTWLDQVTPTAYHLKKWYKENDLGYLEERFQYAGHYGTFAHIMSSILLRHGSIDLKNIDAAVGIYWESNGIEEARFLDKLATMEQWTRKIKNDLICVIAFIQEREFEAKAIEWIGCYDGSEQIPISFASAIDLIGEITFNGTRKTAIIDLKTGSLYADQVYQLIGNKICWNQANPDIEIDLLMNLQPGKASNKSKYTLKNRKVDEGTLANFCDYAKIAARTVRQEPGNITNYDQELSRDSDLSQFVMTAEQYIQTKYQDNEQEISDSTE